MAPKVFNIEAAPFKAEYEYRINKKCDNFQASFNCEWDKNFAYIDNTVFSNSNKTLTVNTDYLTPGEASLKLNIFFNQILLSTIKQNTLFILNKVNNFFKFSAYRKIESRKRHKNILSL